MSGFHPKRKEGEDWDEFLQRVIDFGAYKERIKIIGALYKAEDSIGGGGNGRRVLLQVIQKISDDESGKPE